VEYVADWLEPRTRLVQKIEVLKNALAWRLIPGFLDCVGSVSVDVSLLPVVVPMRSLPQLTGLMKFGFPKAHMRFNDRSLSSPSHTLRGAVLPHSSFGVMSDGTRWAMLCLFASESEEQRRAAVRLFANAGEQLHVWNRSQLLPIFLFCLTS